MILRPFHCSGIRFCHRPSVIHYISKYYRGRYSLTRDPLYAKTWSSPVLALNHATRVMEKVVDCQNNFG